MRWIIAYAGILQAITGLVTIACLINVIVTGLHNGAFILGLISLAAFCWLCTLDRAPARE